MSDYRKIRKAIKTKCIFNQGEAIEAFKNVNDGIEEILKKDKKGVTEEIKALICHFEGTLNRSNYYSIIAVAYALIIGATSVLSNMISTFSDPNDYDNIIFNLNMYNSLLHLIIFSVIMLASLGVFIYVRDYKNKFFLKALYLKLDELNNKSESSKETGKTNETIKNNETDKANDQEESKNYREYVVRIYDK